MAPRSKSFFGNTLQSSLALAPRANALTRYASNQAISPRQKKLFDEADIQNLTIDAQATKTAFGATKSSELHQHAASLVRETVTTILDANQEIHNKEAQAIVEEFTMIQLKMYGNHMIGLLNVGDTVIGQMVSLSLYAEKTEPERKGFLERLFFG